MFLCIVRVGGEEAESTKSSKLVIVVMNAVLWTCMCASGFYGLVIISGDVALT